MSQTVTTICDACGADLGDSGPMPAFRLAVESERRPQSLGFSYAVHVTPPIAQKMHFCGLACLKAKLFPEPGA